MVCPKCGNQLTSTMKFCAKCGSPVAQQSQAQPNQQLQSAAVYYNKPQFVSQVQNKPATSQQPKKKKWKTGDLILKIIAILVGISVVTTVVLIFADSWMYVEETAGSERLDNFPILRQDTELTVYDEKNFPTEIYEIRVEKYEKEDVVFKSEAFNDRKLVFKEISMSRTYNIHFPGDGKYRITLTDLTKSMSEYSVTTTTTSSYDVGENTTKSDSDYWERVVIEVTVEDDNDEAFDKVTLRTTGSDKPTEETTESVGNKNDSEKTEEAENSLLDEDAQYEDISFGEYGRDTDAADNKSENVCKFSDKCNSIEYCRSNKAVTECCSFIFLLKVTNYRADEN